MADWKEWQPVYEKYNLREHGDANEQRGAKEHGLDLRLPHWVEFWRFHVAPCTQRPHNIYHRRTVADVIRKISEVSYALFRDLVHASDSLALVRKGELKYPEFRNCLDTIKSSGDALQKFTDIQTAVEQGLAPELGRTIKLWTPKQWTRSWGPWRERIIGYRNYLTHRSEPQFLLIPSGDGSRMPYVLKRKYVVRKKYLDWIKQKRSYQRNPDRWAPLPDVCADLYDEAIKWLDAAYRRLVWKLRALPSNPAYQRLWGWDARLGPEIQLKATESAMRPFLSLPAFAVMETRSNSVMIATDLRPRYLSRV